MIKEFAVEPEVMATWQHFRNLFHQFGISEGRLISEFPSKWRKQLYEVIAERERKGEITSVKAKSICDRIAASRDRFCSAGGRSFAPTMNSKWIENAVAQQAIHPFGAILAMPESCPEPCEGVLVAGDFDPEAAPWLTERQAKIPRTAVALAACARLLLLNSKELVLVDPNFSPNEPRFRDSLLEFVCSGERTRPWHRCELHTAARPAPNQPNHAHNFGHFLQSALPSGYSIKVYFWYPRSGGDKLHARYLLTEHGGLQFDYGLDTGESGETTVVTLLDQSLWQQLRRDYCSGSVTFLPAQNSPLVVNGQG